MNNSDDAKLVGELLPGKMFLQALRVPHPDLTVVRPRFATQGRRIDGTLKVDLFHVDEHALGIRSIGEFLHENLLADLLEKRLLHSEVYRGEQLIDNDTIDVPVRTGTLNLGDYLVLCISAQFTSTGHAPTLWLSSGSERMDGHVAAYFNGHSLGCYGVWGDVLRSGPHVKQNIPPNLTYSPVTQCNLNCIHCISATTRSSVNRIDEETKDKMREWAAKGRLKFISTDYSGDILWADKRFGGELDFIIELDVPFRVDTNGAYLDKSASERLSTSKVTNVNISLDAARDATYRRIRRGAPPLQDVLENIRGLTEARAEAGASFLITIGMSLMRSNLYEWQDFVKLGARLHVDAINVNHMHAYTEEMERESLWHMPNEFNTAREEALRLASALGIPMTDVPPFHSIEESGHRFCRVPWESAMILGNGDVAACCVPGTVMGNLNRQSMEEIWSGAAYRRLRETVNSSVPPTPCASCPMFRRVGNRDSYLQFSAKKREVIAPTPWLKQWKPGGT